MIPVKPSLGTLLMWWQMELNRLRAIVENRPAQSNRFTDIPQAHETHGD